MRKLRGSILLLVSSMDIVAKANPADEVVPGLLLGSRYAALNPEYLAQKKVKAVFNCTKDIPFDPTVKRQYRVPVDDNLQTEEIANLGRWSYEIVYKIMQEMKRTQAEGGTVLVHCAAGMQRSAASVALYLITTQRMTTDQAVNYIQSKRSIAFRPKINFEPAIRQYESSFTRDMVPQLAAK
jgi:protein-tyrosine phosphatase